MGMNQTPASDRMHIGFFGRRNSGKSSVVNAVTGQKLAIVSEVKGTTTDPVYKAMELLPLGPVMIIDTPGIDDEGELGLLRVAKTRQVLNKTDVAILVIDISEGMQSCDEELIGLFEEKEIPYLVVWNKSDLSAGQLVPEEEHQLLVSALTGSGIYELREKIGSIASIEEPEKRIAADLMEAGDLAVLVVPVDKAAPKGRLILPQQQTIRDILEGGGAAVVVQDFGLKNVLEGLGRKPKLVITDSQAFESVAGDTPEDIFLTSFSILFARYKGNLEQAVRGVRVLDTLKPGSRILISEGCTHHRQCDDIGTVKLPHWIKVYTGKDFSYSWTSGTEFPEAVNEYDLIIHCGGCMLNEREMKYRYKTAAGQQIPMTNYGILIAFVNGILKRSVEMFPQIAELLED